LFCTEGCTRNAMDYAAELGHLEIVKFLHNNRTEGCTIDAMESAADEGHLDIVKFLHNNC
jgi:Ankyrin repeats (3 copies)